MKGWLPIKGMTLQVKDTLYVVSENHYNLSGLFEYRNKENGKRHISTIDKFDEGVRSGLIELV